MELLLPPGAREWELVPAELDADVLREEGPGSELLGSAELKFDGAFDVLVTRTELELDDRDPIVGREADSDSSPGEVLDVSLSGHVVERPLLLAEDVMAGPTLELGIPLPENVEDPADALVPVTLGPPGDGAGLLCELEDAPGLEDGCSEAHDENGPVERRGCLEDGLENGGREGPGVPPDGKVEDGPTEVSFDEGVNNAELDGTKLAGPDGSFEEDGNMRPDETDTELEGIIPPDVELGPLQPVEPTTLGQVLSRIPDELPGPVSVVNPAPESVVAELKVRVVTSVVVSSVT